MNISEEDAESEEEKAADPYSPKKLLKSLSSASRSIGYPSERKKNSEEKPSQETHLENLIKVNF